MNDAQNFDKFVFLVMFKKIRKKNFKKKLKRFSLILILYCVKFKQLKMVDW